MKLQFPTITALVSLALTGCMSAEDPRIEGISFEASNAIAHNNALQLIDPWPEGVQDNDLIVPADRSGDEDAEAVEAQSDIEPITTQ